MYLEEFINYKNQLTDDLLGNEEIVRLMNDKYELTPIEHAGELFRTQLFPYEFIPETVEHGKTFVCFDVDINRSSGRWDFQSGKMTYNPVLYIWIFTHKSLLWLPDGGGVRMDRLASEIVKTINGSHFYGMGTLDLYSVKRFAPMADYNGKVLTFDAKDWNNPSPSGHAWPKNRRDGV